MSENRSTQGLRKVEQDICKAMDEADDHVRKHHRPTVAEQEESKIWASANKRQRAAEKRKDALWSSLKKGRSISLKRLDPDARQKREAIVDSCGFVFSVEQIAKDEGVKRAVRVLTFASIDWPCDVLKGRAIDVEVRLMSYLTRSVPERLRTRRFKVRRQGEILVRASEMYDRIYREDERLGGENTTRRDARLKRQKKPRAVLRNRDEGPYIWGHDIGDLVFEQICLKWTGPRSCVAYLGIGS